YSYLIISRIFVYFYIKPEVITRYIKSLKSYHYFFIYVFVFISTKISFAFTWFK
ncbi:hypothetical protein EcB171_2626, partial [Escherichia coli B171]